MKRNEGVLDRCIRVIIGLAIVAWGFNTGNWWGLIGLIPLITGLVGYCHLYKILGISTIKR
jgi:hypothetical protein